MKNGVEYFNILLIICQGNEWNNWLCVSSCTGNWHRQTTCPLVCAYQYVYTVHTSSAVHTVKHFKTSRAKMLHPVYSRSLIPFPPLSTVLCLYYSGLVFFNRTESFSNLNISQHSMTEGHCSWFISNINPIEIASTIFIVEHLTIHEEMP